MVKEKYSYSKVSTGYNAALNERSEWESEWRQISDFLLPGRGIYQTYSKPRKRKLTSPQVINTTGEDSLYVLTSGMHGGLTSPTRPWFTLEWTDPILRTIEPMVAWLQEAQERIHLALHDSNFYSIINSFYVEYVGFGTGCIFVGEDSDEAIAPVRFELLTAGEYAFAVGASGLPEVFYRTIFLTPRQVVDRFPDTVSKSTKDRVKSNDADTDKTYITVLEYLIKEPYQDKDYTRIFYEVTSVGAVNPSPPGAVGTQTMSQEPLEVSGFYEWPYPIARWNTIGSDIYGVGPGSRALPDIKRLQEMERAFLMAAHKTINPPLNAPVKMRGKLNTLPGGYNYYSNPAETVNEVYQVRFDYQGVMAAIERVEQRIQKNFFNDIFLTASRDPNASPLRTGQVQAQEQEKMLRLGPVIERLQFEFFVPLIDRVFSIMLRKDYFDPIPEQYSDMVGDYKVSVVSPLATAQKTVAINSINSFMGFLGQAAQFDQTILDNIDPDAAAREYADITGVRLGILRPEEDVKRIRDERAEQLARQQQQQEAMAAAGMASQVNAEQASARKDEAEAGVALLEGQQLAQEMGVQ